MFVGIIIGLTMLVISKNTQVVAELSEQLGFIVDGIMSFISKLVPVFVFGSLFNIIASSDLSSLAAGGKFFAGTLAGCVLLILFHTVLACIKMRISPLDLWKRTFSTFIIAISTASSSAAFADNKRTCTEKLGISRRLANFGVPFGQLLYPPGASVLSCLRSRRGALKRRRHHSLRGIRHTESGSFVPDFRDNGRNIRKNSGEIIQGRVHPSPGRPAISACAARGPERGNS